FLYDGAKRVLLFWDMLGYGVTRHILESALPGLRTREHVVIVKDVTDARYHNVDGVSRAAGLLSQSSEIRVLGEFLLRHAIRFETAEHGLRVWRERSREQASEVAEAWGSNEPTPTPLQASDWIYFQVPSTVKMTPNVLGQIRGWVRGRQRNK